MQFKASAEDAAAKPPARIKEIRSLTAFLHKHQDDALSGPSRQALYVAIEQHTARSPADCAALHLLLECALKMPEKLFAESHKARFLKWYDRPAAEGAGGGSAAPSSGSAASETLLTLLDIDSEGALTLAQEDGSLYEGSAVVVQDAGTRASLAAAVAGEAAVTVSLSAAGAFVRATVA